MDEDQSAFGEFVQDAGEVFLGEVEARGDDALAGRQADGEFIGLACLFVILILVVLA